MSQEQFGTESFKLRRNDHPDTSYASAEQVDSATYEALAYKIIYGFGLRGCILDDVRDGFIREGAHKHTQYTNRRTGLHQKGLIMDTGWRRKGDSGRFQAVYVARCLLDDYWFNYILQQPNALNPFYGQFGPNQE